MDEHWGSSTVDHEQKNTSALGSVLEFFGAAGKDKSLRGSRVVVQDACAVRNVVSEPCRTTRLFSTFHLRFNAGTQVGGRLRGHETGRYYRVG